LERPAETAQSAAAGWNARVAFAITAALVVILYAGTLVSLVNDWWNDPGASYGFLVPPIALYLAYVRRAELRQIPARLDSRGLIAIAAGCSVFLIGLLGAEYFVTRFSLIILLVGFCWTFWGLPRTRKLAFSFILLATSIPLPSIIYNRIAVPLQTAAAEMAARTIHAIGGSVYRDGNILQLPHTTLGVAEACSGLHSLASLVVASLILGLTETRSVFMRIVLVALSIPLAIAVNILRVTGTAILADHNPEFADGFYHGFSGRLVFVAGFGLLWLLSKGLQGLGRRMRLGGAV
jgi:exosortase